jgi:hypothetical protein
MTKRLSLVLISTITIFSASSMSVIITGAGSTKQKEYNIVYESDTTQEELTASETTTVNETTETTTEETTIEPTTKEESTTKKRVKKKKKRIEKETTRENLTEKETTKNEENTTEKKTEPQTTKKKSLGSYSESNVVSSSKIGIIRNSIASSVKGSSDTTLTNLAKYMSVQGLSNASKTYKKLTGSVMSINVKTYSVKIDSDASENILDAADKAGKAFSNLGRNKYGIGISSFKASVGYKIYIVVCYN